MNDVAVGIAHRGFAPVERGLNGRLRRNDHNP
jgi:hypothetical protein